MRSRLYSVFQKRDGKWVRITFYPCSLKVARNLYQGILLGGALSGNEMSLRAVRA